jgi:hypothetical protein
MMAEMKFIGGCICLDFVNTVGGRVTGRDIVLRDKLKDYPDLAKRCFASQNPYWAVRRRMNPMSMF